VDAATITALGGLLIAFGGGAWKLIDRADKKRERREVAVEDLLKARVAVLEKQILEKDADHKADMQKQADAFEKERRRNKRNNTRMKAAAGKWREQLLMNDLKPDPADWPEDENDDTE